jgi:hypothetical protein
MALGDGNKRSLSVSELIGLTNVMQGTGQDYVAVSQQLISIVDNPEFRGDFATRLKALTSENFRQTVQRLDARLTGVGRAVTTLGNLSAESAVTDASKASGVFVMPGQAGS